MSAADVDTPSSLREALEGHGDELAERLGRNHSQRTLNLAGSYSRKAAEAIETRDFFIAWARRAGATLDQVAEATGLSRQTVANIQKRQAK